MPHLPHQGDGLQPSEALFNSLSFLLADIISTMPRGPSINGAAPAPFDVLRHMRRHVHIPAFLHEVSGVVALVATYGNLTLAWNLFQHHQCGIALGGAIGLEDFRRHDQSVA